MATVIEIAVLGDDGGSAVFERIVHGPRIGDELRARLVDVRTQCEQRDAAHWGVAILNDALKSEDGELAEVLLAQVVESLASEAGS